MTAFERWSIWVSAILTTVTGLGFFWAKYLVTSDDPWAVINHPLQPWMLKLHIIASPALIFAIGTVWTRHIWRHWRRGTADARRSGLISALVLAPMVATGYLIQVITHVPLLRAMAWSHLGFGLAFAVGLALHQWIVRPMIVRGGGVGGSDAGAGGPRVRARRRPPRRTSIVG